MGNNQQSLERLLRNVSEALEANRRVGLTTLLAKTAVLINDAYVVTAVCSSRDAHIKHMMSFGLNSSQAKGKIFRLQDGTNYEDITKSVIPLFDACSLLEITGSIYGKKCKDDCLDAINRLEKYQKNLSNFTSRKGRDEQIYASMILMDPKTVIVCGTELAAKRTIQSIHPFIPDREPPVYHLGNVINARGKLVFTDDAVMEMIHIARDVLNGHAVAFDNAHMVIDGARKLLRAISSKMGDECNTVDFLRKKLVGYAVVKEIEGIPREIQITDVSDDCTILHGKMNDGSRIAFPLEDIAEAKNEGTYIKIFPKDPVKDATWNLVHLLGKSLIGKTVTWMIDGHPFTGKVKSVHDNFVNISCDDIHWMMELEDILDILD